MIMKIEGSRVFVTGAAGFIGSHLVERLAGLRCEVTALVHYNATSYWHNIEHLPSEVRKKINIVSGDILDQAFLIKALRDHDIVFHLAALISIPYSYVAPQMFVRTNVEGSTNIFEACWANKIKKVVHTSTSEVYGSARYVPIDEDHPLQGQSPYSASKIGADKMAESYFKSFGLPVVTVRPFNTFGPRQSARAVIPTIITQLLQSSAIRMGALYPVRDLNFVENTVDGFIRCAESSKSAGEVINIGYGMGVSIKEVVNAIARIMGIDNVKIMSDRQRVRPKKSEVDRLICNYKKAKKLVGYSPRVTFEEGIRRTVEWIRENQHLFKQKYYAL